MKRLIVITLLSAVVCFPQTVSAKHKNRITTAKYQPVVTFLEPSSTLNIWYKQYVDTTAGRQDFNDFLKKLSTSEILWQRSNRAGLEHNQLYSPIVSLSGKDWKTLDRMSELETADIRLLMLELDIALAAIDATLPNSAHEEFRREVLRGAKPLTEVAKLPKTAVEVMTFTIMDHKVSDRLNTSPPTKTPPPKITPESIMEPKFESGYGKW